MNAIYEPPQQGTAGRLSLERGTAEEQHADLISSGLGWQKVGWIFTQSTKERDFIMSREEICQIAEIQDEMGPHAVTALVAMFPGEDEQPEVHFEVGGAVLGLRCWRGAAAAGARWGGLAPGYLGYMGDDGWEDGYGAVERTVPARSLPGCSFEWVCW